MRLPRRRPGLRSSSAGLVLALLAVLHHASSAKCRDEYEQCREEPDGVHGLDCLGRHSVILPQQFCTWKPGRGPSVKTYTLFIKQARRRGTKTKCKAYLNITGTSADISVNHDVYLSAELFEMSNSGVCTKAVFQGLTKDFMRCGPPVSVSFRRSTGRIGMTVTWQQEEKKKIGHFAVNYSAQGSSLGSQRPLQSENTTAATVEAVSSSLAYTVQVGCVNNSECAQCEWSRAYHVPPELTTAPDLDEAEEAAVAGMPGRRRLSLTWKFTSKAAHDGFKVTISKASGETPIEHFHTPEPRITFILSYSSYHLEIRAFNNASTSPALHHTIRRREEQLGLGTEEPDVTVHSNRSVTISLRDNLMGKYMCYCAEWTERGREAAFASYYSLHNSRTLTLKEPLKPYRRYTLTVHVREQKDACGMKHINSSESTYGSTQFYLMEGSPVGAPANVSSYNVTLDSAALQWSSIPEEDTRGFLLGYVIYYTEYQKGTRMEENVTVNPDVNSHMLEGLKSGTLYKVQICGFTGAGVGVRSEVTAFTTDHHDNSPLSGIIKFAAIMTALLLFGCSIIKRAKQKLWPSIPNPEKSNVMQKMQMSNELELLQSISTLRVEEWETDSLQIVQKEEAISACISAEMPPLLDGSEDEFGDAQETHLNAAPLALAGGYSTMETFRQAVSVSTLVSREREPGVTVLRSQLDYVRQFSTDSTWDNQAPA